MALEVARAEDEVHPPVPAAEMPLLAGAEFGHAIHSIFENCDFVEVGQAADPAALLSGPVAEVIQRELTHQYPAMMAAGADTATRQAACESCAAMVFHALRTPLPGLGMPLCQIPREQRIAEMEFHYLLNSPSPARPIVEGVRINEQGFLTGVIDLVLRSGERYFILDWKSNWLRDGYGRLSLQRAMREHGYTLQRAIYTVALVKWLKATLGARFDYSRHFGGVLYLFVRGMGSGSGEGVWFDPPGDERRIARWERAIERVQGSGIRAQA